MQCASKIKPANMTSDGKNTLTGMHLRPILGTVGAVVRKLINSHPFLHLRIHPTQTPTHAIKAEPTIKRSLGLHTTHLPKLTLKQKTIAAPKSMSSEIVKCSKPAMYKRSTNIGITGIKITPFHHLQCEWT